MEYQTNFEYGRTLEPKHREDFINNKFNELSKSSEYPFASLSIWLNGTYKKPVSETDECKLSIERLNRKKKKILCRIGTGRAYTEEVILMCRQAEAIDIAIEILKNKEEI